MDIPAFGSVLRDVRESQGLSQSALALTLGSTQRHVSFLETGRSQPTSGFVARICRELNLSVAQRANLYAASGHPGPFANRAPSSDEVAAALDMIEARILIHWPYPALVLDASWNVLRANAAFGRVFAAFVPPGNSLPNLLEIFMSEAFRALVTNWDEAAGALFFRLQAAASRDAKIRTIFQQARAENIFPEDFFHGETMPIFVPIHVALPGLPEIEITSLLGKLATTQDALVDGFEIELMVPITESSETMLAALGQS